MPSNIPPYQPIFSNVKEIEDFINNQTEDFYTNCCQDLFEQVLIISSKYFYLEDKAVYYSKKNQIKKVIITPKLIKDIELKLNLNDTALETLSAINYFQDNLYSAFNLWLKYLKIDNIIKYNVTIAIAMDKILEVLELKNNLELKSYIKNKYADFQQLLKVINIKNNDNVVNLSRADIKTKINPDNNQNLPRDLDVNIPELSIEIFTVLYKYIENFWLIFTPEIISEEKPEKEAEEINSYQKESEVTNRDIINDYLAKQYSNKSKVNNNLEGEAKNEHHDNYSSGSLIKQIINNIENLTDIDEAFLDKFKVMPSDNNQILNTLEDVKYLLKVLEPLSLEVHPDFYHEALAFIKDKEKDIENSNNNKLFTERLLIDCKLYALHLINIIALAVNDYSGGEIILDSSDISKFLETLKYYKPELEIKLPSQNKFKPKNLTITKDLFLDKTFEPTPSSLIVKEVFKICIGSGFINYINLDEYVFEPITSNGRIEFILEQVQEKFKIYLIDLEGIDTYRVFNILVTESLKHISKPDERITLSGWDIIKLLKEEDKRDNKGNRLGKEYTLNWVADHVKIIKRLSVYIDGLYTQGKKTICLKQTNLVDIREIDGVYPLNNEGFYDRSKPLLDYNVTFAIGAWLEYFNDSTGNYLNQYGYVHKELLGIKTRNRWAEKIGFWAISALEETRNDPERGFKIKTIIERIGEQAKLESVLNEPNSSKKCYSTKNFKKEFETALNIAFTSFKQDPYHWEYKNPPSWITNDKERKPRGWFNIWLEQVIIIRKPVCLTAVTREIKPVKPVSETKPKLTVENLKTAIAENKVTLRPLAKIYGVSFSWLQRRLKTGKFTQTQLKNLITQCKILGRKT